MPALVEAEVKSDTVQASVVPEAREQRLQGAGQREASVQDLVKPGSSVSD